MLAGIQEVLTEREMSGDAPTMAQVRVHVEWRTIAFKCGIRNLTPSLEMTGGVSNGGQPVLLRVNQAEDDLCRIEIFCADARLCGASAGY